MKRDYRSTMRLKPDLKIIIRVGEKSFSIGAVKLLDGRFHIKRGRGWSEKMPTATLSQVFAEARKFAVRNARK